MICYHNLFFSLSPLLRFCFLLSRYIGAIEGSAKEADTIDAQWDGYLTFWKETWILIEIDKQYETVDVESYHAV